MTSNWEKPAANGQMLFLCLVILEQDLNPGPLLWCLIILGQSPFATAPVLEERKTFPGEEICCWALFGISFGVRDFKASSLVSPIYNVSIIFPYRSVVDLDVQNMHLIAILLSAHQAYI